MKNYQHFTLAAYAYAYQLCKATDEDILEGIRFYQEHLPLEKVYLECHRGLVDISDEQLIHFADLFRQNNIRVAGGITCTAKIGERKPALFDCYCYSDPAHRASLLGQISRTAALFDELILDDFFFTTCRCEMCIAAKGNRSWKDFRLDQMEAFSKEMVATAHAANPKCNFIIKYPNWYESYQECGFNPEKEKDIYDMIHTGTESRSSNYNGQHLQRYLSYSLMRLMENIAPGRNHGGWIDLGDSATNIGIFVQQGELTLFSKGRELTLWNFEAMIHSPAAAALGVALERVDQLLPKLGNPVGVSTYEPYNSEGEDQLINYIGQLGVALEPVPYFDENAKEIFLTENSAMDPDIMPKLEKFVREGGVAVVTSGFMKKTLDRGFSALTSVTPTDRKVTGTRYQLTNFNIANYEISVSDEPATFTIMSHKNNATWYDVLLHVNDLSTAIMTEDYYGKGYLYILNIPDNYGDLYKLPAEVLGAIGKNFSRHLPVYLSAKAPFNMYLYDNDVIGLYNLNGYLSRSEVVLLGEEYLGFEDLETGEKFTVPHHLNPRPFAFGDSATFREEPLEQVFRLPVQPGEYRFYRILKK